MRAGKELKALLSGGTHDKHAMNRAFHLNVDISSGWSGVFVYGNAIKDVERKSLRLTPQGQAIFSGYLEAAHQVYYECHVLYLDAQVLTKKITQAQRDEDVEYARKRYAYQVVGMDAMRK